MKITLRRAAKLRNRAAGRLQEIQNTHLNHLAVNVNIYDPDVVDQLSGKAEDFNEAFVRYIVLSGVLVRLRQAVGKVNTQEGIDDLLAEQVALLGQRAVVSRIAALTQFRPTEAQIKARLEGQAETNKAGRGYGSTDTTNLVFLTENVVEDAQNQLQTIQTRLDEIQDRLEAINASRTIELSDQTLVTLTAEKLI
jgi:hypothetical protein